MTQRTVITPADLGSGLAVNLVTNKVQALPSTDVGNGLAFGSDNLLYSPLTVALTLPTPRISLIDPTGVYATALNPNNTNTSHPIGGSAPGEFVMTRMPVFSSAGIDPALLAPALDLRLELLWYRKASSAKKTGWHHPNHNDSITVKYDEPVAKKLPNTPLRGGWGFHCTEWSITSTNQSFIIGSLAQFFKPRDVAYVDTRGSQNAALVGAYVPTYAIRLRASNGFHYGRARSYDPSYRPNYFAFRFSTANPSATNGQRTEGPLSPVIVMGNSVFPFNADAAASSTYSRQCASIAAGYVPEKFNCWFGTRVTS